MRNNDFHAFFYFFEREDPEDREQAIAEMIVDLASTYFREVLNAETFGEIEDLLVALTEEAWSSGYRTAIKEDIEFKNEWLSEWE